MKKIINSVIGLLCLSASLCFARPPECDPGPHGCDNKLLKKALVLKIHPFKLVDKTGKVHLLVEGNGKIEAEGKAVGTISKDGSVVDLDGKLLAVLRETSILEDSTGTPLVSIAADGSMDNGSGVKIRWTRNGTLKQGNSLLDVKLVTAYSSVRRTASTVYFLINNLQGPKIEELPTPGK